MKSIVLLVVAIAAVSYSDALIGRGTFRVLNERSRHGLDSNSEDSPFLQSIYQSNAPVPDELDWRKVSGRVTEVKNQLNCTSSWAFAAAGLLEGQEKLHANLANNDLVSLSAQNLVDCVSENYGCRGGKISEAFDWIKQNGIDDEGSYPYKSENGKCKFDKNKSVITLKGYDVLPQGDENKLKEVVAKYGPVAAIIDRHSENFMYYKHGVYADDDCDDDIESVTLNVLIVGYGTDPKEGEYWIVKNSWGSEWGENGYIRMARNKNNSCGIATWVSIATF